MSTFWMTAALGVLISVLGVINMTGNISSLHRYHRKRVSEENRKPFGKLVGIGTLIVGISLVIYSALLFVSERTNAAALSIGAAVFLAVGVVIGLVFNFYAMIKYNGGIF